jgi:hypothetical protein
MLKIIKKSATCAFGIMPLAVIILIVNFKKSPASGSSVVPVAIVAKAAFIDDLPCGFKAQGSPQLPEKPTFFTNDGTPVLQYPAGSFPGTTAQIPNVLYSENQNDQLILQPDGNLVIYCVTCIPTKALWSKQTNGKGGQTLFFQSNGDLVLHNAGGKVIWHSNIISKCAGSEQAYFTLQDDGNLAMLFDQVISKPNSTETTTVTAYLGGTASTNDQAKMAHPGKLQ